MKWAYLGLNGTVSKISEYFLLWAYFCVHLQKHPGLEVPDAPIRVIGTTNDSYL